MPLECPGITMRITLGKAWGGGTGHEGALPSCLSGGIRSFALRLLIDCLLLVCVGGAEKSGRFPTQGEHRVSLPSCPSRG